MVAPKPSEKRVWPNGRPVDVGAVHAATCPRAKDDARVTAWWCPCGHVERVIAHSKTPERIAEIRAHVPTYPKV